MTQLSAVGLVTPSDPAAPGDLVASGALGIIALVRAQPPRVRAAIRLHPNEDPVAVSGAQVSPEEIAVLELDASGRGTVFKVGANGASDLFEVPAPARGASYPANSDAVALGPKNEVATLRTPSGGDPPSSHDPAVILQPGAPPLALAPWSTLKTADAPECRAETGGWRATVASLKPWVKVAGDVHLEEDAPMFARVRWSVARVCLEAIEVRLEDSQARVFIRGQLGRPRPDQPMRGATTPEDVQLETWLVARFAGGPAATRLIVVPGFEQRTTMTCGF
jgi:hypothetical protein